ncbi:hypothetical protein DP939_11955 [Spongiactinospora rosea]|uniref:TAXI family TRAP transporter solute-binding subunit n=1 Tax=Spongiactinospora rosea TaxID=2248750 RepID=A0A366M4N6_9ACTN|nr:hypothetical protein DP939_11955 [Spongiactinospora rosea]
MPAAPPRRLGASVSVARVRAPRWRTAVVLAAVLTTIVTACANPALPAAPRGPIRIASGSAGGVYALYGGALAHLVRQRFPETAAEPITTVGSVENIELITAGKAEAGFVLADIASDAVTGREAFPGGRPIVALARLYDNYVQLVVRANGPIRTMADLAGRRVSIGAKGSGTAVVSERVLRLAGLYDDVVLAHEEISPSARALELGELDAFFWSGGLPSEGITGLRASTPVRLIDLGQTAGMLTRQYGELYTETTVPASVYGLADEVGTVSVPNYLVVHRDLPEPAAYWLTRTLFEEQPRLADVHGEARRLDAGSAIMTYPLDLHPGAARWYRRQHR